MALKSITKVLKKVTNKLKGNKTTAKTKTKTKAKTANQIAFEKESKRIKQFIRRTEQRGYTFDKKILKLLEKPKQVRNSRIEKLKKLNANELYKNAYYTDKNGQIHSGLEGRKLERADSSKKGWETRKRRKKNQKPAGSESISDKGVKYEERKVLKNVNLSVLKRLLDVLYEFIGRAVNPSLAQSLLDVLLDAIQNEGADQVAYVIMNMKTPFPEGKQLYNDKMVDAYITEFNTEMMRKGWMTLQQVKDVSQVLDENDIEDYILD